MTPGLVKEMADLIVLIAALPEKRQRSLARCWTLDVEMVEDMEAMTREEFDRLRELKAAEHSKRRAKKRREIERLLRKLGWLPPPDGPDSR